MGGLVDLYNRATGAISQATDDYVLDPIRKGLGVYEPRKNQTQLPTDSRMRNDSISDSPLETFPRTTRPKKLPQNLPAYRADERRNTIETQANPNLDMRSPARIGIPLLFKPTQTKTSLNIQELYTFARTAGAAKALGLPTIKPDMLGAIMLKEGRSDFGFGGFEPQAKPDLDFQKLLNKQYNLNQDQKEFLGLINYTQRVSKKKGIPFEAVWNGLGVGEGGKTGFDYAKTMKAHQTALQHPKNKQLRNFINSAYSTGEKYKLPLTANRQQDTDPYLKSDPKYEYHTPEGILKPHGIKALFKASGGIIIDDGNPAKQRKLI